MLSLDHLAVRSCRLGSFTYILKHSLLFFFLFLISFILPGALHVHLLFSSCQASPCGLSYRFDDSERTPFPLVFISSLFARLLLFISFFCRWLLVNIFLSRLETVELKSVAFRGVCSPPVDN